MNNFIREKELLLNSIEKNTSEHWKNYYKNVPSDYIYDDLVIDINEIKRLEQENRKLKGKIEKAIDKLYLWGEALDSKFQKEMLEILKEKGEE